MKKTLGHLIDTIITCKGKYSNVCASHIDDNLDTVYMCLGVLVRVISLDPAALQNFLPTLNCQMADYISFDSHEYFMVL
jgi:hypothetical protein